MPRLKSCPVTTKCWIKWITTEPAHSSIRLSQFLKEFHSLFILHITRFTIESLLKVSNQLFPNCIHRYIPSRYHLGQRRNPSTLVILVMSVSSHASQQYLNATGNNLIKPGHVCGAIEGQTMACDQVTVVHLPSSL